jgi:nicotinate-nucleotide adenylyltransferase
VADGASPTTRWGILGGVFDPIHFAHLAIAEQVRDALRLDGVVFVPASVPVHRAPASAAADERVRMIELAIADNPCFSVSGVEIESNGPRYSADTVAQMSAERPSDSFVFILSAESAAHLPEWREPERLIDLAEVAVVPRLGYANLPREWLEAHFPGRVDRFAFVNTSVLGHSSSDIRARVASGRSIRYLVPPAVESHIGEHSLYGADVRPEA